MRGDPNPSTAMPQTALAAFLAAPLLLLALDDGPGWTGVLDEESFAALHELKEGDAPELLGEDVEIAGTTAYLARPEGLEPLGAVVVIHEWWGLNDHVKHWADRLAADGYVALAVDLYGGVVATSREDAMKAMRAVEDEAALEVMRAAHAWLVDPEGDVAVDRTACIGWCFGGGRSLQLAMNEPELDAAIVYYGRLVTDAEALASIEAPMLGVFGTEDAGIPPASVAAFEDAMDEAGKDLTVRSYEAEHAFANPSSARYDAESASAAWLETRTFLCEHMWPESPGGLFSDRSRPLDGKVPFGWGEGRSSSMRVGSFSVGSCDVSVIPLRSDGGGALANYSRWSGQVGGDELTEDDLDALPRIPVLGRMTPVLEARGPLRAMGGASIDDGALIALLVELEDEVLSLKLSGPASEVDEAAADFERYCRSLR